MTAGDVVQALREQNVQVSGGAIGAPPIDADNAFQYTVTTQGRFEDAREFRYVIVKSTDGRPADRAAGRRAHRARRQGLRHQLLSERQAGRGARRSSSGRAPTRSPRPTRSSGKMERAVKRFPDRARPTRSSTTRPSSSPSRSTRSTRRSFEAVVLVVIVIIVFLQSWRTAIIPIVAIPVSLIGTFAVLCGLRLLAQHADAVRPGAGHRHRRRRRHRRGRERRAQHRARAVARATPRTAPWTRSAPRSSRSRWC